MLRTSDLDYDLPDALIADRPIGASEGASRDAARLMVVPRAGGTGRDHGEALAIEHRHVRDLPLLLRRGDLLVFNTSRVIPARLVGFKRALNDSDGAKGGWGTARGSETQGGGRVEGLYLGTESQQSSGGLGQVVWRVLLKGARLRVGTLVRFESPEGRASLEAELIGKVESRDSGPSPWLIRVTDPGGAAKAGPSPSQWLSAIGHTPLPPYILKRRAANALGGGAQGVSDAMDREWYQTVVANESGSVAAPTAGLHFTASLLRSLEAAGVGVGHVQLHVGLGTFRPVQSEHIEEHPMHVEACRVPAEAARAIEATRAGGGRIIAVGTTAARTLEAWAADCGAPQGSEGSPRPAGALDPHQWFDTRLLITPGYAWRVVDGLVTNFHLPRTTLLAMVASRLDASGGGCSSEATSSGLRRLLDAYRLAVACRYRFFSYGDAMLVLP